MLNKKVKFLALLVLIISLAITMTACDMGNDIVDEVEDETEVVEFEDSNLEEVIRDKINKPEGDILLDDVLDIEELEAPGKDIESIEGIQHLSNLKTLYLGGYYDSDAGEMKYNKISDISPLSNLTNLEWLGFSENEVSNIIPLENLTNLEELWFGWNEISNIGPLANLTNLEGLSFIFNEVSDISPLVENDGFGTGDVIDMRYNYLDLTAGSEDMNNIYTLIDRGVNVEFRPQN